MYRGDERGCPACREPMQRAEIAGDDGSPVAIDLCAACGGTYFEFFDGEPAGLAHTLLGHAQATPRGSRPVSTSAECPECGTEMAHHRYMEVGPSVARCDACMSLFATQAELRALARFVPPEQARTPAAEPPSAFERFLSRIARALGT